MLERHHGFEQLEQNQPNIMVPVNFLLDDAGRRRDHDLMFLVNGVINYINEFHYTVIVGFNRYCAVYAMP